MRLAPLASLLILSTILAGCAGTPTQSPKNLAWQERVEQLSALSQWSASGKLAIRTANNSQSASLEWQQSGPVTRIYLTGPMGLGATSIESDQKTLRVNRDGHTQTYDISSGIPRDAGITSDLPLQALPHWIRGLPNPTTPVEERVLEHNLLQKLRQQGWTITFEDYRRFEHYTLPTRIKIERDDTQARLILRNWTGFSR